MNVFVLVLKVSTALVPQFTTPEKKTTPLDWKENLSVVVFSLNYHLQIGKTHK